jgi:hypothetical protein
MAERAPRYVPLISGTVALAVAVALLAFWRTPVGVLYWVRGALFGFITWYGLWDLKVAAFASDDQIRKATAGDTGVWREAEVAAPSAFNLKDLSFLGSALGVLHTSTPVPRRGRTFTQDASELQAALGQIEPSREPRPNGRCRIRYC